MRGSPRLKMRGVQTALSAALAIAWVLALGAALFDPSPALAASLSKVAKKGRIEEVRMLIEAGADVDANRDGYVTATEIGAYVAPRVTNETDARQSPQSGRLAGEGEIAFKVAPRR